MSKNVSNNSSTSSFPIFGLMFLVLFTGKMFEVTPWLANLSWVWVTAPLWIGFLLWILVFIIVVIVTILNS